MGRGRSCAAILLVVAVMQFTAGPALAAPKPAPVFERGASECAWRRLTDAQRDFMTNGGDVERRSTMVSIGLAATPPDFDIANAAVACGVPADALTTLAMGLKWRAKEEGMRQAIARFGRDPAVVDQALSLLFVTRRVQMGDALSCPGETRIEPDWDRSVAAALQRTRNTTLIRTTYAFAALALYARAGQEGAERRLRGLAAACEG
jgi:hypothetical protein